MKTTASRPRGRGGDWPFFSDSADKFLSKKNIYSCPDNISVYQQDEQSFLGLLFLATGMSFDHSVDFSNTCETGMICKAEMYGSTLRDLNRGIFGRLNVFAPTHALKIATVNERIIR